MKNTSNKMSLSDYKKKYKKESDHQAQGLELLKLCGCIVWRQNVGATKYKCNKTGNERYVSFGVKGLPDVMGYKPSDNNNPYPTPIYWEVKRAGGRIRQEQKNFIDQAKQSGCFAVIGTFDQLRDEIINKGWL